MQSREEGAFRRDASYPESTAHDHVDPHGLLDTKNMSPEGGDSGDRDLNDASYPESTAHDHVDPHGLLDTKNIVSTTVRVVVDGYCSQEVPGGRTGGEMVWCSSRTLLKAMVGLASSKVARRVE